MDGNLGDVLREWFAAHQHEFGENAPSISAAIDRLVRSPESRTSIAMVDPQKAVRYLPGSEQEMARAAIEEAQQWAQTGASGTAPSPVPIVPIVPSPSNAGPGAMPSHPAAPNNSPATWAAPTQPVATTESTPFKASRWRRPAATGRSRSRIAQLALSGIFVVALIAFGVLFARGLFTSIGAASPEEAAEQFLAAVADGDVVGLATVLHPDEAGPLAESITTIFDRLEELGYSETGDSEDRIPSLSVTFDSLTPEILADEVTALVRIENLQISTTQEDETDESVAGDGSGGDESGIAAYLPGFGLARPNDLSADVDVDGVMPETISRSGIKEPLAPTLVVVLDDGRWFVSASMTAVYTLLAAQSDGEMNEPRFSETDRHSSGGSDTAEDVIRDVMDDVAVWDIDNLIELMHPGEAAVVYAYQDTIESRLAGDYRMELRSEVSVMTDALSVTSEELDGGLTRVSVDNAFVRTTYDDGWSYLNVDLQGSCARFDGDGSETLCLSDFDDPFEPYLSWIAYFDDYGISVVVEEIDGRWYLNPLSTLNEYIQFAAPQLTEDLLDSVLLGDPQPYELGAPILHQGERYSDPLVLRTVVDEPEILEISATEGCIYVDNVASQARACNSNVQSVLVAPGEVSIFAVNQSTEPLVEGSIRVVSPVSLEVGRAAALAPGPQGEYRYYEVVNAEPVRLVGSVEGLSRSMRIHDLRLAEELAGTTAFEFLVDWQWESDIAQTWTYSSSDVAGETLFALLEPGRWVIEVNSGNLEQDFALSIVPG